jgi:putative intracellular protease/amidase
MPTILFAVTASPVWTMKDGSTLPAGFWAEEVVDPYQILTDAGHTVLVATPGGAPAPLQTYSLDESMTGSAERSAQLKAALDALGDKLQHPVALSSVNDTDIDAIYIPGGTGPMEDLCADRDLGRILTELQTRNALISAACHGPAALLSARDDNGRWIFAGYQATGYSNEEEKQGSPGEAAPFRLETKLREEGAWSPFVIRDRNLITGQNPASAAEIARQLAAVFTAR